jgi:hypothetical protein
MSRVTTRIVLGLSLILAIGVAGLSLSVLDSPTAPAWATLAAALAVVTSAIAAWGAQRVVELEEDRLQPYPYPHFDATSRYGLMLLRVTNSGGGVAHDIELEWDRPLTNSGGKEIRFSAERSSPEIPVLMPGQSISMLVDGHIQFFEMKKKHGYSGKIRFKDGTGKTKQHRFVLDAEMLRGTLLHDKEELKTHYEVQRLPDALKKIEMELSRIRSALEADREPSNES